MIGGPFGPVFFWSVWAFTVLLALRSGEAPTIRYVVDALEREQAALPADDPARDSLSQMSSDLRNRHHMPIRK